MRTLLISLAVCMTFTQASAEETTRLSDFRAIGTICGSGLALDVKGTIDIAITRLLGNNLQTDGDVQLNVGDVVSILEQLDTDEAKSSAYSKYVECVTSGMNSLSTAKIRDPNDPNVSTIFNPSLLGVAQSGQEFSLKPRSSIALINKSTIFTSYPINQCASKLSINSVDDSYSEMHRPGDIVRFNNNRCAIVYIGCEARENYSFILNCK